MTDVEGTYEGFLASRRSGRRNAVHEIEGGTGEAAADLSQTLAQLNINKSADDEEEDTESSQDSPSKEEETQGEGS